jgi:glycosyltransferase involved in cell wall biosynthesis
MEQSLLRKADLVVVSAQSLLESKSPYNAHTVLVRHGVQFDHFARALHPSTIVPADIASLPKPVIGYFGLMADDWIDVDLLAKVAERFSSGSLVLIGKATTDMSKVAKLPNVHLIGRKPFEELPAYCKGFDVALNAFPINDVTLNANPLKVREYLAAGLPVVSSRIPEVEVLGDLVHVGDDHEGFLRGIEEALRDPGPKRERSERCGARAGEVATTSCAATSPTSASAEYARLPTRQEHRANEHRRTRLRARRARAPARRAGRFCRGAAPRR